MGQVISSVFGIQSSRTNQPRFDEGSSTTRNELLSPSAAVWSSTTSSSPSSSAITRFPPPTCKEQLLDWTRDATATVHHLHHVLQRLRFMGRNVVLSFHAYNRTPSGGAAATSSSSSVVDFLPEDTMIRVVALETCSCIEFNMAKLSMNEFRRVLYLLSRTIQLDQMIQNRMASTTTSECKVCWVDPEQVLLPKCLHGICRTCHERWVGTEKSCPFCRQPFRSSKKLHQDEWEIEQWNSCEVENDIDQMEVELKRLLWVSPRLRSLSDDDDHHDGKDVLVPMTATEIVITVEADEERDDDDGFSRLETREQQDVSSY